jgi:carbon storage regulator
MLVLTRKVGQKISIGDDVEVTVLQVSGDQVRLGIEAPRELRVHRAEVLEQIARENILAAESASSVEDIDEVLPPPRAGDEVDEEA